MDYQLLLKLFAILLVLAVLSIQLLLNLVSVYVWYQMKKSKNRYKSLYEDTAMQLHYLQLNNIQLEKIIIKSHIIHYVTHTDGFISIDKIVPKEDNQ